MLRIASFEIQDANGMNSLLAKHTLYGDASILVSEGKIAIPYEDGELPNTDQKINKVKELRNKEQAKVEDFHHQQRVHQVTLKGIQKQIGELEEKLDDTETQLNDVSKEKGSYEKTKILKEQKKDLEKEIVRLQNVENQTANMIIMAQSEITRLTTEIAVYNEELHLLENPDVKSTEE